MRWMPAASNHPPREGDEVKAQTKQLWAPIITPKRGKEWICWICMSPTRRGSKEDFLQDVPEKDQAEVLKGVRFAKVTITER